MIKLDELKLIIIAWADSLHHDSRIYVFGSYLKGKKEPSDVDIAFEFLNPLGKEVRRDIWNNHRKDWQQYLSEKVGAKIDLQLFEGSDSPKMQRCLKDAA